MIFPWVDGIFGFNKAPLTWMLILLNLFLFIITSEPSPQKFSSFNESDVKWIHSVSKKLYQMEFTPESLVRYQFHDLSDQALAYKLALEPRFLKDVQKISDSMDSIEFNYRVQKIQSAQDELYHRKIYYFGFVSRFYDRWATWFTYQFMHGGLLHLLSNLIMLLIFGGALEQKIGSFALITCYILSGVMGALLFFAFENDSIVPLVGASASITGIIASYLVLEKKKFVAFYYFLGFQFVDKIYVPNFILVFYFLVDDLASWLSQDSQLGAGVAHIAHIGGFLFGVLFALILRYEKIMRTRRQCAG